VQLGYDEKKQIVPIRLENATLVGGLALLLGSLQRIDLFGNHIDQQISALGSLLPKPPTTDVEPELAEAVRLLQLSTERDALDRALDILNRILINRPSTSEAWYHRGYIFVLRDLHRSAAGDLTR